MQSGLLIKQKKMNDGQGTWDIGRDKNFMSMNCTLKLKV